MVAQLCRQTDPYYPFEQAVDVWARTFAALGINYKVGPLDPKQTPTYMSLRFYSCYHNAGTVAQLDGVDSADKTLVVAGVDDAVGSVRP